MSLLNLPTVESATGETKEIFEEFQAAFGMLPNAIRLWSINPSLLRNLWNSIKALSSTSQENQKLYTFIRYLVADKGECEYCIGFNASLLINIFNIPQDELEVIRKDNSKVPLDTKHKALLLFAMQSIHDAESVNTKDIDAMKKLDISEREMFDIVHAASNMLVVNTLFKTFKLEHDH